MNTLDFPANKPYRHHILVEHMEGIKMEKFIKKIELTIKKKFSIPSD